VFKNSAGAFKFLYGVRSNYINTLASQGAAVQKFGHSDDLERQAREEGAMTQVLDMIEKGSVSDADVRDGMWLASVSGRKTIYSSYAN
jgi:hypothetical protein